MAITASRLVLRCLVIGLGLWPALNALDIHLRERVVLADDRAQLVDIADYQSDPEIAQRLDAVLVQRLPDIGERIVDAGLVQARIGAALPGLAVSVRGSCTVVRASRSYSSANLVAATISDLRQRLGAEVDVEIQTTQVPEPIIVADHRDHAWRLVTEPLIRLDGDEASYRLRLLADEREVARRLIILRLTRYRRVLVATRILRRGTPLQLGDLREERRALSGHLPGAVPTLATVIGCVLRSDIAPGEPVYDNFLQRPALVQGGARVRLIYEGARFSLTVLGTALGDGQAGDQIRVRPINADRLVTAEVIGPGLVRVAGL